jgi:hypothetical protein
MPPLELTGERVRRIAAKIRDVFSKHHLPIDGSPLAGSLEDLDWLGREDGPIFRPGGPYERDKDRANQAVVAVVRLTRISQCMEKCVDLPGFRGVARHLRSLQTVLEDPQGARRAQTGRQAWDLLFETEVAGLLTASGYAVRMEEPDLVLALDREPGFAIACKRPQSVPGIRRAVCDAGSQILKQHPAGLILVNIDAILGNNHPLGGYAFLETTAQVDAACQRAINGVVEPASLPVAQGLADAGGGEWPHIGAIGVLFVANFVVSAAYPERSCKYMNAKTMVAMVADLKSQEGAEVVAFLKEQLVLGQAVLRSENE